MISETLAEKLKYSRAYRKTRLDVAQWVIEHPETFPDLLNFCFKTEEEISYRATWVLEFVCAEKLNLLLHHLDLFLKKIPKVHKDQALRPLAKICEMLVVAYYKNKDPSVIKTLELKHKETLTECCFDWLITKQKVACKVYSMMTLYYLGTEFEWIHPELRIIIEQNIHNESAAYKARGRMTLEKISKFNKNKHQK